MVEQFQNFGETTLSGAVDASQTTWTVTTGSVFPSSGTFRVLVDDEIALVTARSTNSLTVTRGAEGTTAATHASGASIRMVLTTASLERAVQQYGPAYDVMAYGATGNGTTDDSPAIQAAITACAAAGGGVVWLPAGTYILGAYSGAYNAVSMSSGVHLLGAGPGATILKAGSGADVHMVNFAGVADVSIRGLEIDGNSATQTIAGHGIAGQGGERVVLEDLYIHDTYGYGVGLQYVTGGGGTYHGLWLRRIRIEDTGTDGIDLKNNESTNTDVFFDSISVARPGRRVADSAGIDIRGEVIASDISVSGLDAAVMRGIDFQETDTVGLNGEGGARSVLTNFRIEASHDGARPLLISNPRVNVSNGYISGGQYGVWFLDDATNDGYEASATNVTVVGAYDYGFHVQAPRSRVIGCTVIGPGTVGGLGRGMRLQNANQVVSGCLVKDCAADGIYLVNTATDSRIVDNVLTGNTPDLNIVAGLGSGTVVRGNVGYVTENTGATSVADGGTVAHGLAATPIEVTVTPSVAGEFVSVTALGASTFTVAIKKHDGTAGTTQTVYWRARAVV